MTQGTKWKGTKVMGMAASQARFLGLTARKTNVEYEGQQINQQRTALSNETASYYTDLLGMSVPVPPSIEDYTKTVYILSAIIQNGRMILRLLRLHLFFIQELHLLRHLLLMHSEKNIW